MTEKVKAKKTRKAIAKKAIAKKAIAKKSDVKLLELSDVRLSMINGYRKNAADEKKEQFESLLATYLKQEAGKHECSDKYNVLILFDHLTMMKSDSDKIYSAVNSFDNNKPLLLILFSSGGDPGPAYLIGKLCQEYCNGKFIVTIPRHAKSAATLLSCAATEIHMGSLSELGPIDPQINEKPVLGLKNTIEHIAGLAKKYPDAQDMFAKYLSLSIDPVQIGYYERVAESAVQYAARLMQAHRESLANTPEDIAEKLVYEYKDHGFVIDKKEAMDIFGSSIVKHNTPEYKLGNSIYEILSSLHFLAGRLGYNFYFIGSTDTKPNIFSK